MKHNFNLFVEAKSAGESLVNHNFNLFVEAKSAGESLVNHNFNLFKKRNLRVVSMAVRILATRQFISLLHHQLRKNAPFAKVFVKYVNLLIRIVEL